MPFTNRPFEQEQLTADLDLIEVEPLKLVLWNDDVNTFDWVIESLVAICRHNPLQAEQCAFLVHHKGKAIVKELSDETKLKAMCQALCDRGLSATID